MDVYDCDILIVGGGAAGLRAAIAAAEASPKLDIRVQTLLPMLNASTELGRAGIAEYARRNGVSPEEYAKRFDPPLTPEIMGRSVVELHEQPQKWDAPAYVMSGKVI